MNTIEIELRYKVMDVHSLTPFLQPLEKIQEKRDSDIYLDAPDAILYQRGIFIRERNGSKLDFKFNKACLDNPDLSIQDYCEEHSFSLPLSDRDLPKMNAVIHTLGLVPLEEARLDAFKLLNNLGTHYVVDKQRTTYRHGSFEIAIDEVRDLGTFLEIELMASTTDELAPVKKQMQELLFGLPLEPLRTGYGTLLLRKYHFDHYLCGRFILEEDKAHKKIDNA